ncbi:MAG TPA: hypothetical protein VNP92_02245 [Actinophytocola sp.]|nr:hypothetical protein [Actinophytocola sp.]
MTTSCVDREVEARGSPLEVPLEEHRAGAAGHSAQEWPGGP